MRRLLELKDFALFKLHVDWQTGTGEAFELSENPWFDYDIFRKEDDERELMLQLKVRAFSVKESSDSRLYVDAVIAGIFHFSDDASNDEIQHLIRVNGCTILYGLLRGQIASVTGSFPESKYVLPAVYMQEVVAKIESRIMDQEGQQEDK